MPARICCTVIAGVHFFPPPGFGHEKPRCDQRKYLMMMPALPIAHLVVGQTGLALGTLDTFLDAMFGFGGTGELRFACVRAGIGQVVIGLDDAPRVTLSEAGNDQDFFMAFLPLLGSCHHAPLDHLDEERTF